MRREWRIREGFDEFLLVPWFARSGPEHDEVSLPMQDWYCSSLDRFTLIDICQELDLLWGDFSRISTHNLVEAVGRALQGGRLVVSRIPRRSLAANGAVMTSAATEMPPRQPRPSAPPLPTGSRCAASMQMGGPCLARATC